MFCCIWALRLTAAPPLTWCYYFQVCKWAQDATGAYLHINVIIYLCMNVNTYLSNNTWVQESSWSAKARRNALYSRQWVCCWITWTDCIFIYVDYRSGFINDAVYSTNHNYSRHFLKAFTEYSLLHKLLYPIVWYVIMSQAATRDTHR